MQMPNYELNIFNEGFNLKHVLKYFSLSPRACLLHETLF